MTAPTTPRPAPLNERVAALVNEVLREATKGEAPELVDRLRREAERWKQRETTLVVAGEPNRGKSSLINAVLGVDVLPSGTGVATSCYVVVRHGAEPGASVFLEGRTEPLRVELSEVATWAAAGAGSDVRAVIVEVDHPLLEAGLTIVDTPGVGGLDAAHGRVTLSALSRADALVFVLDASAPLSEPELRFLERATERIDQVLFVVNRTDQFRGWAVITDDDRTLLERHAPRFARSPIFPVSAKLKAAADALAASGTPDDDLLAESGIPGLAGALRSSVLGHSALLRLANLLRVADAVVGELEVPVRTTIEASTGEPEAKRAAERDQERLDGLRDRAERLNVTIADRFAALREQLNSDLNRSLRDIAARHAQAEAGKSTDEVVSAVETELRAVDADLEDTIAREVDAIVATVASGLDDEAFQLAVSSPRDASSIELANLLGTTDDSDGDPMLRMRLASAVVSGGTGVAMFSRYMATGGGAIAWFVGAGVVLGMATAGMNLRMARKQRDAAAARKQLQVAIETVREEIGPRLRSQLLGVQRELEADLRGFVRQRTRELQASVAESTQLARTDAAARQRTRTEAERQLALLESHRAAVAALQTEVERVRIA